MYFSIRFHGPQAHSIYLTITPSSIVLMIFQKLSSTLHQTSITGLPSRSPVPIYTPGFTTKVEQSTCPGKLLCSLTLARIFGSLTRFFFNVDTPFLIGTNDQYEIGDLSGKYGTFLNLTSYNGTHLDYNLPLFGKNSIQGRSVVIHKMKVMNSMRWVCADVHQKMAEVDKMFVMKTKITFTGPDVMGYILLVSEFYCHFSV